MAIGFSFPTIHAGKGRLGTGQSCPAILFSECSEILSFFGFSLAWANPDTNAISPPVQNTTPAPTAPKPAIPAQPSAPPELGRKPPPTPGFGCKRFFLYEGKLRECDSNLYMDAEKLRPLLNDVPASLSELDLYQQNRLSIKKLAYISTLGLAIAGFGTLIAGQHFEGNQQNVVRNLTVIPGLLITAGSTVYGFSLLRLNENHLAKAVDHFNQAHPDNSIELQFSTGFKF